MQYYLMKMMKYHHHPRALDQYWNWRWSEDLPVVGDLAQIADVLTECDLNAQFGCKIDECSQVLGMVLSVQEDQECYGCEGCN
jgi:hypothetical protein